MIYRNSASAKRLEEAQAEFEAAASALVAANRSARAEGKQFTPEMRERAERLNTVQQRLKEAEADFDLVTGGPEPVELTPLVIRKVRKLFPPNEQSDVIRLLEKECARNLPFSEDDTAQDLERVRLAVLKLAGGRLLELRRQIEVAKRDWRDVLNAAEYPEGSRLGLVEYGKLAPEARSEIDARDKQQHLAWLQEE
jgi:hypothetical protein